MLTISWAHLSGLGIILLPCMITDLHNRTLPAVYMTICLIIAGLVNRFVLHMDTVQMLAGGILGAAFIGIAVVSRGEIGIGDGILITVLGVWCGFGTTLFMTLTALISAAAVGLAMLIIRKENAKKEYPLAPFFVIPWAALVIMRIAESAGGGV